MHRFLYCGYFIIALLSLGCHVSMPKDIDLTTVQGTIAIAPLGTERAYRDDTDLFRETLFTQLANARRLNLVDRNHLDKVIAEQEFQTTDLVEPKTAVRIGRLVGAEYIFVGTLRSNPAAEDMFTINVRLISVEKGEVISGWSVDTSKKELTVTARTMADRILRELIASLYPQAYTPASTALASTFVPGSGQLLNKRKSGYAFLPAGLLSALAVGLTQAVLISAHDEQYDAMKLSEYQRLGKNVDDKRRIRNVTLGVAGVIWLINVIDTYFESRSEVRKYYQAVKTQHSEK